MSAIPENRIAPAILYLASIDFPHAKARAIQIVNTCHALARAGCRVTLVVGRRETGPLELQLERYGLSPHPRLRIVGLPAFRLPPSAPSALRKLYTRFWNWSYLAGCLALLPVLLRQGPTVLLARDYRLAWLLLKLQRWHRRPLAFEVHGLPSAELLDHPAPAPAVLREAARRRALEQAVFRGAWRLLPITDCLRRKLLDDYRAEPIRVLTVPDAGGQAPGVNDQAGVGVTRLATLLPPASSSQSPRLIYVGQLYAHKGVDLLLRSMSQIREAELVIVGGLDGDPERPRLERLAAEFGVAKRVRFLGPRPYAEIPAILAGASVALLPLADGLVARCFTSPLKLFDYLAAGLPIVAVDFPTIREVLRDGENALLVPPGDPSALAAAVNRLLDDPALAARLAAQARQDATAHTWSHRAERIIAALNSAIAAPVPAMDMESAMPLAPPAGQGSVRAAPPDPAGTR